MIDEILTSREVMKLFRLGRTTLWTLTRSGEIPCYRIGKGKTSAFRYKRSEVMAWLESRRHVVEEAPPPPMTMPELIQANREIESALYEAATTKVGGTD